MSLSLREQLMKAGLVTEKQAKKAERQASQQKHRTRQSGSPPPVAAQATREAQAAKAARDQALNRARAEKAAAKARSAELRQLIEQHRVPPVESDDYYSFVDGSRVCRIAVTPALRARLAAGTLLIARCDGRYSLLPAEVSGRIRERDPAAIVERPAASAATAAEDDPYKDFVVPDDLTW